MNFCREGFPHLFLRLNFEHTVSMVSMLNSLILRVIRNFRCKGNAKNFTKYLEGRTCTIWAIVSLMYLQPRTTGSVCYGP